MFDAEYRLTSALKFSLIANPQTCRPQQEEDLGMKMGKKLVMFGIMGSVAVSGTAQAACWTPAEVDAAKIRDLQSRLMVSALRCEKSEHNLLPEYNRFVRNKKPMLQMGNDVLRAHFAKGKTKQQALEDYDRYAVSLANSYGAGSGGLSECEGMKHLARSAADSENNLSSLINVTKLSILSPHLPDGRCGIVLASSN